MFRILFLSTGKSGISLVPGSILRKKIPADIEVTCASEFKTLGHPLVLKRLRSLSGKHFQPEILPLAEIQYYPFDLVITLCAVGKDEERCPKFPGSPPRLHWHIPELELIENGHSELSELIHRISLVIEEKITHLLEGGYLEALKNQRQTLTSLLENMVDGIMAHDKNRRIVYFNRAAQRITGYTYADVINRDCHEVFPGRFCGGNCAYCEKSLSGNDRVRYYTTFKQKNGDLRDLEMSSVSIDTADREAISTLIVFRVANETESTEKTYQTFHGFQGIITQNPLMEDIFNSIREVANINVPVMIQGESGTGKEMVANAIHNLSSRATQPFVPVNCGALPEGTIESELFGHVKGAFTGAFRDKKGRFELAHKGTIFLDEIGELTQAMQVKLLRVLQNNSFNPVGGEKVVFVDARIICATNRDLVAMMKRGDFREDLYYRLMVVPVSLPPLREKTVDIPLLVDYFLNKFANLTGRKVFEISAPAMSLLMKYYWPGNIRELSNTIQYALIKCHEEIIDVEHLPDEIVNQLSDLPRSGQVGRNPKLMREEVVETLMKTGGNKSKAARILGVSRPTLYSYLKSSSL